MTRPRPLSALVLERRYRHGAEQEWSRWRHAMSFPPAVTTILGHEVPGETSVTVEFPDHSAVQYRRTIKEQS